MSKIMVPIAHFNEGRVKNPVKTGASLVFPDQKPSPLEVKPITSANNLELHEVGGSMKEAKVIKRYQNRKLYDTHESSYVTLDEIAKMIRAGEEIRVIDNKTKNDITAATLTQLLYESERKAKTQPSVNLLKTIIRSGDGSFSGFIAEKLKGELASIEAEAAAANASANVSNAPLMNQ
jgi:polyhydroxyalkanoate synthesis repressor PhaR